MPTQFLANADAAIQAVAQPQNGSKTKSPSLLDAEIDDIRCRWFCDFY